MEIPRLREWREIRGLTQSQLAEKAGVARDSISKWETGERGAYPGTVEKLAKALAIEIIDLVRRPGDFYPKAEGPISLEWALDAARSELKEALFAVSEERRLELTAQCSLILSNAWDAYDRLNSSTADFSERFAELRHYYRRVRFVRTMAAKRYPPIGLAQEVRDDA